MDDIVKLIIKKSTAKQSPTTSSESDCSSSIVKPPPMTPPEYHKKYVSPNRRNNKKPQQDNKDNKREQRKARFAKNSSSSSSQSSYGFVSRGEDNRLQQSAYDRERFFISIIGQFIQFNSQTQIGDIRSLINEGDLQTANAEVVNPPTDKITMDSILLSIRKLREALLYTKPTPFHKKVFLFSLRLAAIVGHYQTYIPSINYLLHHNKFQLQLTQEEVGEIATLLILHLVHFNSDFSRAHDVYFKYIPEDKPTLDIIQAWIHHDYVKWFHFVSIQEDPYKLAIMKLGSDKMKRWLIESIEAAMYKVDKKWLEMELGSGEISTKELTGTNWRVEDGTVVIKDRITQNKATVAK